MTTTLYDPRLESVLLEPEDIQHIVIRIAENIAVELPRLDAPLNVVGLLKGAVFFTTDLARALSDLGIDVRLDFIRTSTYKTGIKKTGETVRNVSISNLSGSYAGEQVLLVDDILDQGFTLSAVKNFFLDEQKASQVKTCVFMSKKLTNPSEEVRALRASFRVDYCGMEAPDRWVVGYGLDISDEFRALPYIAIAREECFR